MSCVPEQRSDYTRHWCLQYCYTTQRLGHWRRRKFGCCACLRWQFCCVSGASQEETGAEMWMFGRSLVSLTTYGTEDSRTLVTWCACCVSCAQPLTLRPSVGYKTTRATKEEIAGQFARGFQDSGFQGEGPTVVESRCLSAAGARRPVRCAGVTDVLSHVRSSNGQCFSTEL